MRVLRSIILATTLLLSCLTVQAQDTRSQEAKKAKLEKEMAVLDKQIKDTKAKSQSALSQLELSRKKVSLQKEMVAESDKQIRVYSDEIYVHQKQINELQRRVDTLSAYYSRLVTAAYKNRDTRIWYMYILASDNISQGLRRYSYFKNLSNNLKEQATKLRETKEELEFEKLELERLKKESEGLRSKRKQEQASLEAQQAQDQQLVNELQRNRKKYENELASKRKQVEALNKEIQRIIAAAMKSSSGKNGKAAKSDGKKMEIDAALAAEFSKNKGKLPWPVDGSVISKFGQRSHPAFPNVVLPANNGIDIVVPANSKVCAVFDGVVKQIMVLPGYNQCVLVQHGNYFTLYCKVKSASVKAGDKVKTGQQIGLVDTLNGDTQLHFEVWKSQSPQNPEAWLK